MTLSKFALLVVALVAALVASLKPADILPLVSASFSLAASAFFPALVLGIFWKRATRRGAVAGMLAGLGVTVYYMVVNAPAVRAALGLGGRTAAVVRHPADRRRRVRRGACGLLP